jgi:NAD(P)H-dependent FMN reductase
VISLSEHNGTYSAAFKNIFDWTSRVTGKVFQDKPLLLLATSNGARGGIAVLNSAIDRWKYMGGNIKASFNLPEFDKNFDTKSGITQKEFKDKLLVAVEKTQQETVLS